MKAAKEKNKKTNVQVDSDTETIPYIGDSDSETVNYVPDSDT